MFPDHVSKHNTCIQVNDNSFETRHQKQGKHPGWSSCYVQVTGIKSIEKIKLRLTLFRMFLVSSALRYIYNRSNQNIRRGFVSSDRVSYSGVPGSIPVSSDVRNKCSPPTSFHGVHKDSLPFNLTGFNISWASGYLTCGSLKLAASLSGEKAVFPWKLEVLLARLFDAQ